LKIKNSTWSVNGGVVAAKQGKCGATMEAQRQKDWWQQIGRMVAPKSKSDGREEEFFFFLKGW